MCGNTILYDLALALFAALTVVADDRLNGRRHTLGQSHFHENQRFIFEGGVEIGETSSICCEPLLQVTPIFNAVNRFILDDFLKNGGFCIPVDPFQGEKAGIEPLGKQLLQVFIHSRQLRMITQEAQEVLPQRDDSRRTVRCHIHSAEQLLTVRFHRG